MKRFYRPVAVSYEKNIQAVRPFRWSSKVKLIVAGVVLDGWFKKISGETGISDAVVFTGMIPQMRPLSIKAADFFISASTGEDAGVDLFESIAE